MGLFWVFIMFCRSRIVLCMLLVLNVTSFMGGCRYSFVVGMWCCSFLFLGIVDGGMGVRLDVACVLCHLLYCSNVVCLYLVVSMGGFRCGITLGAGNAILMRGGACAAELRLMVG